MDRGRAHVVWTEARGILHVVHDSSGLGVPAIVAERGSRQRIAITPDGCPQIVWQANRIEYLGFERAGSDCVPRPLQVLNERDNETQDRLPIIAADPAGAGWISTLRSRPIDRWYDRLHVTRIAGGREDPPIRADFDPTRLYLGTHDLAVTADGRVHLARLASGPRFGDLVRVALEGQRLGPVRKVSDLDAGTFTRRGALSFALASAGPRLVAVWFTTDDYDGDGVEDTDVVYRLIDP